MNLAALLRDNARRLPSRAAIDAPRDVLSYAAAWERVTGLMQWLRERGVQPGERVAVALADHADHLLLHYAIAGVGAVLLPLDHRWSEAERAAAVAAFGARHCVDVDPPSRLPSGPEALAAGDAASWLISLSSGSTGRPRGALVTHRQMRERFVSQWVTLGFNATDRFALVSPLCFGAGRSFGMAFLAAGATVVLRPPPHSTERLLQVVRESRSTATFLVPTLLRRLVDLADPSPLLPDLRRLLLSGEACAPAEAARFRERVSPNLIGYYASSEGGGISVLQPDEFRTHADSVGRAAFGVEVELVDEQGRAVADGEVGLVRYRGPGVATQFLDEHGRPGPAEDGGWFMPGDLATRDADGYLRLAGRAKDMIVRAGVNVYPAEVERVLRGHPAIADAAVIGEASATHGESVVACVVWRPGRAADAAQLADHCRGQLAPYKVPSRFVVLPQLPQAGMGKTDKKALRRLLVPAV